MLGVQITIDDKSEQELVEYITCMLSAERNPDMQGFSVRLSCSFFAASSSYVHLLTK